jgi:hypothetical protein
VSGKKTVDKSSTPKKKAAAKSSNDKPQSEEMWIARKPLSPNAATTRKWSEPTSSPASSRILELADIALGLKKPENFRKRRSGILKQKP